MQRNRSANNPSYVLPEKAAALLAAAVTPPVSVEWLRYGRGPMDVPTTPTAPRQSLIGHLGRSIAELTAVGDWEATRIATHALARLLGEQSEPAHPAAIPPDAPAITTPKATGTTG